MPSRRSLLLAGLAFGAFAPLAGGPLFVARPAHAQGGPVDRTGAPLRVIASFSILADMVRAIGGEGVVVDALVGPDADAHVFQPTPADARRLAQAQVVVVMGQGFEGWMTRLVRSAAYKGPVVTASQGIRGRRMPEAKAGGHSHGHSHANEIDPHMWHDPRRAQQMVRTIADALAKADPARAAAFRAGADAYVAQLQDLDRWAEARFAALAPDQRRIVTSHDSFGYLAERYGLTVLSPQGISTEAEATAQQVAQLIRQVRDRQVRAIFVENVTNPRLIEQIASETGAVVGGRLYSDALSGPTGPAPTYLAMMRHNVAAIADAIVR
jgi:zinc/manganese transport system substrate-binding protein